MRDGVAANATTSRKGSKQVAALAFSRDGQLVAVASNDGAEQVWQLSGELVSEFSPRATAILSTEFEPGGKSILAANADGTAVVTDIDTGLPITVLNGPEGSIREAQFMAGSRVIGVARDATWIWHASPPYRRWASDVIDADCGVGTTPSPDERYLAIGCRSHPTLVWDTQRDQLLGSLPSVSRVEGNYTSAFPAVSNKGDRGAIARGSSVDVYELESGSLLYRVDQHAPVNAVMFGPNGRDLVTGATDGSIILARGDTTLELAPMPGGIDAVAITEDGRILAADATRCLRIYRPDGTPASNVELPGRVMALRTAGTRAVTVPIIPQYDVRDSPPVLLDLDRAELVELKGHSGRVFSARWAGPHQVITAGADHTVRRWDGRTGALQQTYKGGSQYLADAARYDENTVIGGGEDGVLRFWDSTTGELLWALQAHQTPIVGLHVEANNVVTRGFDGQVERWTITAAEAALATCRQNPRCAIVR